ncbi:MAG TPA: SDR family oxidoreductase [Myxococcales bacterium]|jgi:uncharacterized protein YbjT (DUF2867 family)
MTLSDSRHVLVTAAVGNVGSEVVRALLSRGVPVVAADRDPSRVGKLFGEGTVRAVALDFARPETFDEAARGARAVFLVRPPPISDVGPTLNAFVDRAAAAGAEHVVFLSVIGAGKQSWVPHHKVERHLKDSKLAYTLLRPGFFAQNLGDAYRRDLVERDELYLPSGRGKVAFVDVRDLAEVAARACEDPSARGQAWDLTGGEAVSFAQAAEELTRVLGRPIRYTPASVAGYLLRQRRRRMSWGQALVQAVLHVGIRFGNAERVDPTLERLLQRRPRTLADYVREHRHLWDRSGDAR